MMNLGENLGEIASDGSKINAVINSANFNILHFNAQSLVPRENSTKFDEIRNLIMDCDIDAVGITETWYKEFIYDSAVSIPGFKLFRKDRSGCRGGGVCLYIRNNLKTGNIFDEQYDVNVESLFVEIILEDNSVALLGVIYLPNGQFLCCERVLENFSSRYNNIILMGDFNINLFINGAIVREICERLSLYIVHNSLPTHYSPQQLSTSLIDFYLVSDIELVSSKHQFQIPALNSYHAAIFITYNISQFKNPDIYLCRDYSNLSYDQCLLQLESMNFSGVYDSLNVDESVECFNSNLNRLFEDNVPNRRVVKSVVHNWMNEECICSAKRIRDLTYRAYRENRSDRNFEAYRRARNRLKTIIRGVRRKYCLRFFSTCDQKQLWCKIKSIGIVKSPGNERFPISLNEFNEFSRMAGTADGGLDHLPSSEGFTFANVTETDVLNAVLSIKSQAVGADQIHIKFLKFIILPILKHLTFIINRVLTTSVVPKIWKVGRIVPIPKVKIPRNCSDYRPISILSVCSKVLELIIREQMLHHLNSCSLIHPHQSGFRKGFSTTGTLLEITETIRENFDKDLVSILIFLDYCKAFDSINHSLLIHKLSHTFGYSSSACKLIYSFLHGRSQFVQIEREVSSRIPIYRGVPQGSMLGPLLFLLYINDIYHELNFLKCYTYADDIQLLSTFDLLSLQNSEAHINSELDLLVDWSKRNFLQLNAMKCKVMVFSKQSISLNIILNNEVLEIVPHYKTLGIILDDKLTFSFHINSVISRISWTLRKLYNIGFYLPSSIKRRVALSLCLPLLIYGIEVYSCTSNSNIDRLKRSFNSVVRYIYGLRISDHVSQYYVDLLGCSFFRYVQLRKMIFFFKTIKYGKPDYLQNKFNFAISNRTHSLICPAHVSLFMTRSFRVNIARLWNTVIPYQERKFSHSLYAFKNIFLSNS